MSELYTLPESYSGEWEEVIPFLKVGEVGCCLGILTIQAEPTVWLENVFTLTHCACR
jgi:hypothetical protein